MRLGSGKPLLNPTIPGLAPVAERDSSVIQNVKPEELVSFHPCMYPAQLMTI